MVQIYKKLENRPFLKRQDEFLSLVVKVKSFQLKEVKTHLLMVLLYLNNSILISHIHRSLLLLPILELFYLTFLNPAFPLFNFLVYLILK